MQVAEDEPLPLKVAFVAAAGIINPCRVHHLPFTVCESPCLTLPSNPIITAVSMNNSRRERSRHGNRDRPGGAALAAAAAFTPSLISTARLA